MAEYVTSALFVHTPDTEKLVPKFQNNSLGVEVTPVSFDELMREPRSRLEGIDHVVVSGDMEVLGN